MLPILLFPVLFSLPEFSLPEFPLSPGFTSGFVSGVSSGLLSTEVSSFNAFIDYRAEIGKPMTDRAVHLALNKLMELSDTTQGRIAVINQSIERGWTGLFPVKEPAAKKKPGNKFGNFHQRDYDYSDMEKRMVEQRVKCSE